MEDKLETLSLGDATQQARIEDAIAAKYAKMMAAKEEELVKSFAAKEEELVKSLAAKDKELVKSFAAKEELLKSFAKQLAGKDTQIAVLSQSGAGIV